MRSEKHRSLALAVCCVPPDRLVAYNAMPYTAVSASMSSESASNAVDSAIHPTITSARNITPLIVSSITSVRCSSPTASSAQSHPLTDHAPRAHPPVLLHKDGCDDRKNEQCEERRRDHAAYDYRCQGSLDLATNACCDRHRYKSGDIRDGGREHGLEAGFRSRNDRDLALLASVECVADRGDQSICPLNCTAMPVGAINPTAAALNGMSRHHNAKIAPTAAKGMHV